MKRFYRVSSILVLILLVSSVLLAGCTGGSGNQSQTPTGTATPTGVSSSEKPFTWPATMQFAATGSSGEAKMVSWVSVMDSDLTNTIIRVVNEAAWTNTFSDMSKSKYLISQIDKSAFRDCIEAIQDYALPDGGPWMGGLIWTDSLAASGFLVRGNSSIYKPEDIKPGTKIAIWNDKAATMSPLRSLLAWGQVNEKDIIWVNTGDYDAGPRAVVEGRADICMAAPVTPTVMEASAAPSGIRYISLNPKDNPEGAKRFLQGSPLYDFGPITAGPKSAIGTWAVIGYKYLGANMNTDPELVYNIVKWLDQNYAKYGDRYESNVNMTYNDLLAALQTIYMPFHPGLVKYLKEKGVWNADYEKRNQKNIALFQKYIDGYKDAMTQAAAQKIDVKPNNQEWIKFWENYKLEKKIPLIRMHVSLTQDAVETMPPGYIPPGVDATATPAPADTPVLSNKDIPIEIVSINEAHPGEDVTVKIKTTPGAEVKIQFTMPNGQISAFPPDNTKTAGADGTITWTWNINSHVPAGIATYTLVAKFNGKETTLTLKKKI